MSFMKETVDGCLPTWNACADTAFIQELKTGALPFEKFKHYIIQDSIYLKQYARVYGKAMYDSTNLKDVQFFYSILNFVTNTESAVRLSYLKRFGIKDDEIELITPTPENQDYIDFMFMVAGRGDICEILMAVLPCMLSYSYIFRKIASDPMAKQSAYWDFISDYADEHYACDCASWSAFADKKCNHLPDSDKERLADIFKKASELELDFWKMAYRKTQPKNCISQRNISDYCLRKKAGGILYENGIEHRRV